MSYFWVENFSYLCKLIVCGSQILRSTHGPPTGFGFQNIVLPNSVFTVENSADNNPIHTQQVRTHNMRGVKPITEEHLLTNGPAELHKVKPVQF